MVVLRGEPIKCLVIGDDGVGKTSMLMNYATDRFPSKYVPSMFDNYAGSLEISGKKYNLQLLDSTDKEDRDHDRRHNYPGTDVFIVCFSVVKPETYFSMQRRWIPEIQKCMPDTPFVIVGTQVDLRDDPDVLNVLHTKGQRPISYRAAASYARRIGSSCYLECSPVMKKRLRRVMNDAFKFVFCPRDPHFSGCTIL